MACHSRHAIGYVLEITENRFGSTLAPYGGMSLSQQVQPHKNPAPLSLLTSIVIAALGGFVGGVLIEHGPTYFNVHVTQPVLGDAGTNSEFVSAQAPATQPEEPTEEPLPVAPQTAAEQTEPEIVAMGADARIVVSDGKSTYLVLQGKAPLASGTGAISASSPDEMLTTIKQATDTSALAAPQTEWIGANVTLYDEQGFACSGTIGKLVLLEQFAGDGLTREGWDEYADGPMLAAQVHSDHGSCKDASWGRHGTHQAPSIGRILRGSKAERRDARKAFRRTKAYRRFQKQFLADGQTGNWDAYWDNELTIRVIRSAEQELVFVEAQVGGCGEFEAQLGVLFERQADGTLKALASENPFLGDIKAAADIDGDGDLDFISQGDGFNRALMRQDGEGLTTQSQSDVGIYYCRC